MAHRDATCTFRFYAELNDFLPSERRQQDIVHPIRGTPSVKDTIEAIGIPHTEVDLILVDGASVDFAHTLRGGERISVYPMFERLELAGVTRLRPKPLREPRFVLDVHLGKLARYLRLAGFDTLYDNARNDDEIAQVSVEERRIVLTRDRGLLKRARVTHGYWLRNHEPRAQFREVVSALDLQARLRPFSRCMECNGELRRVPRQDVLGRVPPRVASRFERFSECRDCGRVYWRGSHYERLLAVLDELPPGTSARQL